MKIGITQIILGSMSLDDTLALCRDAGYEAVELVFAEDKDLRVDMGDGELAQVAGKCSAAGIEIGSVIVQPQERGNLLSPDADQRELCLKRLRRSVEIAAVLGVDGVLLHPGALSVEADYRQAWNNFRDALRGVAPLAEDRGVAIGVENVWNKFLLSPLEARLFVEEVGSDAVGICGFNSQVHLSRCVKKQ
ncbi:MAG: sugar phosphate isomerase/epimerase family protein, partial [Candidatus Latescibacterota bacterium]